MHHIETIQSKTTSFFNEEGNYSKFCRPDTERSCFRCCPPIRPVGCDYGKPNPVFYRQLLENTQALQNHPPETKPISGWGCWGLGFLNQKLNLVGCLLHPARNQGLDLRDLTGYGDKCRRELCREAVIFSSLSPPQADLVLNLTTGLDSFAYSSEKSNPAFRLLLWGPKVIEHLTDLEPKGLKRGDYQARWLILDQELNPARDGYPVELLLDRYSLTELAHPGFLARYRIVLKRFIAEHRRVIKPPLDSRPFVHQLPGPASLARFLRTALDWDRASPGQVQGAVQALAERMNREL